VTIEARPGSLFECTRGRVLAGRPSDGVAGGSTSGERLFGGLASSSNKRGEAERGSQKGEEANGGSQPQNPSRIRPK